MVSVVELVAGDLGDRVPALLIRSFGDLNLSVATPDHPEWIDLKEDLDRVVPVRSREALLALPGPWRRALRKSGGADNLRTRNRVLFAGYLKDGREFFGATDRRAFSMLRQAAEN